MRFHSTMRIHLLAILLAPGVVQCTQAEVHRFPAVVDTDAPNIASMESVRTSMLLRVDMKYYGIDGVGLEGLDSAHLDETEQTVLAYLISIRTSDRNRFRSLHYVPQAAQSGSKARTEIPSDADWPMSLFPKFFNGFQNVRLESRIFLQEGDLLIWKAQGPQGWQRQGSFTRSVQGRVRVGEVMSGYPLELFILQCLQGLPSESLQNLEVPLSDRCQFALALDPSGAALEFEGQYLDVEVGKNAVNLPPPARILHNAILTLRKRNVEGFLSFFTNESRARLREWYADMRGGPFESYRSAETGPKYVKFILNADPVFLVFYTPVLGNDWSDSLLSYRYILRTAGGLKIANQNSQAFLDDVLLSNKYLARFVKGAAPPKIETGLGMR